MAVVGGRGGFDGGVGGARLLLGRASHDARLWSSGTVGEAACRLADGRGHILN